MPKKSGQTTEEKYRVLLDINNAIITNRDRESLFEDVTESTAQHYAVRSGEHYALSP